MKYIIISVIAIAAVFGICFLVTGIIRRKDRRKKQITTADRVRLLSYPTCNSFALKTEHPIRLVKTDAPKPSSQQSLCVDEML